MMSVSVAAINSGELTQPPLEQAAANESITSEFTVHKCSLWVIKPPPHLMTTVPPMLMLYNSP